MPENPPADPLPAPKPLWVGDVLHFGRGERAIIVELRTDGIGSYQPVGKDDRQRRRGMDVQNGWTGTYRNRGYEALVERNIFTDGRGEWEVTRQAITERTLPCYLVRYQGHLLVVRLEQWREYGLPDPKA